MDQGEICEDVEFRVQPYQFEPTVRPELSSESSESDDEDEPVISDSQIVDEWCDCNNCGEMPSRTENRCCHSFQLCMEKIEEAGITCITQHPAFRVNCLNRDVLELAFYEYLDYNGPIGDEEPVHELYRYIAYRRYTRWMWHRLGKKIRKVIPSCVVLEIRRAFPSEQYTGFKYPRDY